MNIASILTDVKEPDRPAIVFSGAERSAITFREMDDLSSRLATGMEAGGLRPGDRIIVLAPISIRLYASLIALFKMGATAVFLDPQTGYAQLNRAIALVEARAFIGTYKTAWLRYFSPALRRIPLLFLSEGDGIGSLDHIARTFSPRTGIADVDSNTPALITFTGGSTDLSPRGVLRTHHLLIEQHRALNRLLPVQANDIDLPAFPVAALHNLASGITSVIPDFPFRRPDAVQPERILRQIQDGGATTASGSPAYWSAIVRYCLHSKKVLSLRRVVTGGAPTSPELMNQLSRIAPNAEILNVYGSSEAEPVAMISARELPDEMIRRIEMGAGIPLGRPVAGVFVRVLDKNQQEESANQAGEIWVSGEHVARGYFANPPADAMNKRFDSDGRVWHRMGDIGYSDNDGCLWLLGRVNTLITRAGQLFYPVPVETVIGTLPYIQRAALIGAPDKLLGEQTVLIVEFAKDNYRPADWREQIQSLLAKRGWIIDEIRSMRKLPVDARHNARIDYQKLQRMIRR
jgi:acyl-CoA synthetase (AMP-forming)/AMP-acid ligase II